LPVNRRPTGAICTSPVERTLKDIRISADCFRDTSEAETGHAFGHLDFLKEVGDPATGEPIGNTEANLKASAEGETYEYTQMYPGMAKTARDEGFDELAEWFETLAKAERSHANRFTKGLESLKQS
jgi:rubrerythrin